MLFFQVMKVAQRICELSKPVVALGKSVFYQQITQSRDDAYRWVAINVLHLSNIFLGAHSCF